MNTEGEGDFIGRFSILANAKGFCASKGSLSHFCLLFSYLGKTLYLTSDQPQRLLFIESSAFFQFQIATVTEKGVEIEGPLSAETNWDIAHMIR